jgi:hypothetical protein
MGMKINWRSLWNDKATATVTCESRLPSGSLSQRSDAAGKRCYSAGVAFCSFLEGYSNIYRLCYASEPKVR